MELMTTNADGQVTGTHHLKDSQAYPPSMGTAIVSAWETWGAADAKASCSAEPAIANDTDNDSEDGRAAAKKKCDNGKGNQKKRSKKEGNGKKGNKKKGNENMGKEKKVDKKKDSVGLCQPVHHASAQLQRQRQF